MQTTALQRIKIVQFMLIVLYDNLRHKIVKILGPIAPIQRPYKKVLFIFLFRNSIFYDT